MKLGNAADHRTWRTLRRILRTHSILTTRFPLENGDVVSVRKAGLPSRSSERFHKSGPSSHFAPLVLRRGSLRSTLRSERRLAEKGGFEPPVHP